MASFVRAVSSAESHHNKKKKNALNHGAANIKLRWKILIVLVVLGAQDAMNDI